jgi:predicted LPLAT superfamily acyltransferase
MLYIFIICLLKAIYFNHKILYGCLICHYHILHKSLADPVAVQSEARALSAHTLDRGFKSHLRHGCLSSPVYDVLSCVGRGLATS